VDDRALLLARRKPAVALARRRKPTRHGAIHIGGVASFRASFRAFFQAFRDFCKALRLVKRGRKHDDGDRNGYGDCLFVTVIPTRIAHGERDERTHQYGNKHKSGDGG
jgi:hypothetical protein